MATPPDKPEDAVARRPDKTSDKTTGQDKRAAPIGVLDREGGTRDFLRGHVGA
jgi:hypothetical protein